MAAKKKAKKKAAKKKIGYSKRGLSIGFMTSIYDQVAPPPRRKKK